MLTPEPTHTKPSVYVVRRLAERVMAALADRFRLVGPPASDHIPATDILRDGVRDAVGLLTTLTEQVDTAVFDAAPQLKIVANCAVGYNNIDVDEAKRRGIVVTNTPDILTDATADLTWALLLSAARRIPEGHALVQSRQWAGWGPTQLLGSDVTGRTLGIIGMGRIGEAVARRAAGFRMPVRYVARTPRPHLPTDWCAVSLDELLGESDVVSLHVPLTAVTHHLIGAPELARMKHGAFLINTSRGAVVDEAALTAALRAGRLGGAGLDVYEKEPRLDEGLYGCPNVVTLPHLGSATHSTRIAMGMACVRNLTAALIEGKEPPNRVA
jgi:glyoxylate reductase